MEIIKNHNQEQAFSIKKEYRKMNVSDLNVLYEDNHVLAVLKPAGILVQGDKTGDLSLLEIAKHWLIQKYQKPGNAFLGLVHRLDRPVAGVIVFAKTSKAASRLSTQFRERMVQKFYLAVVEGQISPSSGTLLHYIRKRPGNRRVHISEEPIPEGSNAELSYTVLEEISDKSLVHIIIHTGRHHQIRAQLAYIGHPIVGDHKYQSSITLPDKYLALFAAQIRFMHPTLKTEMTIQAPFPDQRPWTLFAMKELRVNNSL
jgi:23S rRNA pseudouridine1911/1915/1917 synthase